MCPQHHCDTNGTRCSRAACMYILMTTGLFVQHVMPAVLICMIASVATMTDACLYLVLLFEIETKLIVLGKAPQLIMEEIATYGVFGEHYRMPAGVMVFQDISHDTPCTFTLRQGDRPAPEKKGRVSAILHQAGPCTDAAGMVTREVQELHWSRQGNHAAPYDPQSDGCLVVDYDQLPTYLKTICSAKSYIKQWNGIFFMAFSIDFGMPMA